MLTDYHTHTPLCLHAEGHPREYVRQARERGLAEIGFSDHNPMPEYFDDWRMPMADFPKYLDIVEEARAENPGFPIRLALECDYLVGHEKWLEKTQSLADWDYLIGSVHYLPGGWEVDHPKYIARHRGDADQIWRDYWALYERCIRSGLFDFVAHPDLPKKFGITPDGDLRRYYEPSVAALAEQGVPFEINTAGMRRDCREEYPSRTFIELANAAGVPLLINSDAHAPHDVAAGFEDAAALAQSCGYRHTLRFSKRQRSSVAISGT